MPQFEKYAFIVAHADHAPILDKLAAPQAAALIAIKLNGLVRYRAKGIKLHRKARWRTVIVAPALLSFRDRRSGANCPKVVTPNSLEAARQIHPAEVAKQNALTLLMRTATNTGQGNSPGE